MHRTGLFWLLVLCGAVVLMALLVY